MRIGQVRLLIACGYSFFLLYAQFGFIELLHEMDLREDEIQWVMGSMALAGIITSFSMAIKPQYFMDGLKRGMILGLMATATSLMGSSFEMMLLSAVMMGIGVAMATVALASNLKYWVEPSRLGWEAGWGTGMAYVFCNLPMVFNASPTSKGLIALMLALIFLSIERKLTLQKSMIRYRESESEYHHRFLNQLNKKTKFLPLASLNLSTGIINGFMLLLILTILVWVDSSVYFIIQHTPELKARSWGNAHQLLSQGMFHMAGALLTGWMLDRGYWRWTGLLTWCLFMLGFTFIQSDENFSFVHAGLYAIGISMYSAQLVALPCYRHSLLPKGYERFKAGALYGLAGWTASTLGIGMASDLHHIPMVFMLLSGLIILVCTLITIRISLRGVVSKFLIPLLLLGVLEWELNRMVSVQSPGSAITRGRQVYMNEGCINCHSQYIRPGSQDEELYGPVQTHTPMDQIPLIGNRRVGPDLSNAGLLKSPLWHQLHLKNPRLFQSKSVMPSYKYLFQSEQGEDLVAYLSSLGKDHFQEYWNARILTTEYPVAENSTETSIVNHLDRGNLLYSENCKSCHGEFQRSNDHSGPLVALGLDAPELKPIVMGYLNSEGQLNSQSKKLLTTWIRYGVPNGNMPAHEHLSKQDIFHIIQYLEFESRLGASEQELRLSMNTD